MALHREMKETDLHEPSRVRILNNTGGQISSGTWVFVGVAEDTNGFIPVSRTATSGEKDVALVTTNIAAGASSTALTLGRINDVDTSSFVVGDYLELASSTTYVTSSFSNSVIGKVIVSSSTAGVIAVDSISIDINTQQGSSIFSGVGALTTLTSTSTDIPLVSPIVDSGFSYSSPEVTVSNAGRYKIEFSGRAILGHGTGVDGSFINIDRSTDGGSNFDFLRISTIEMVGSSGSNVESDAYVSLVINLNAGDIIKLTGRRSGSTGTVQVLNPALLIQSI